MRKGNLPNFLVRIESSKPLSKLVKDIKKENYGSRKMNKDVDFAPPNLVLTPSRVKLSL
jgi:hypothetical protein